MPRKPKKPKKRFAPGSSIGKNAIRAWVCENRHWHDAAPPPDKRTKGKRICSVCGSRAHHFDSRAEARRYIELNMLQASGEVQMLKCQPVFELNVNGVSLGKYVADFAYLPSTAFHEGDWIFEDVKGGHMTELSDLKRRLAEAIHGVKVDVLIKK